MTGGICLGMLLFIPLFIPLINRVIKQARVSGSVIMREDYVFDENGDLITDHGRFVASERVLIVQTENGQRRIPFDDIRGIFIEVGRSRKVFMGVIVEQQAEWLQLGIIAQHDLRQAGINGHRIAEAIGGEAEGERFLGDFGNYEWSRTLLGAQFVYTLSAHQSAHNA